MTEKTGTAGLLFGAPSVAYRDRPVLCPGCGYTMIHSATVTDRGETSRAKTDEFAHKLYYEESDFAVVDRVGEIAAKRGVSNAQVALAWLLHQPGVTAPIVGASKPHHLDDALAAATLKLDQAELQALEEPYRPHPVLGHN